MSGMTGPMTRLAMSKLTAVSSSVYITTEAGTGPPMRVVSSML